MIMMKKMINILLCVSCLLAVGCSAKSETIVKNDDYAIIRQDGQYFMTLHKNVSKSSIAGSGTIKYPTYAKVSEMKEAILNNTFSDSDRAAIKIMAYQNNNKVPICNLDTLYEPVLPDSMKYKQVTWVGEHYYFNFSKGDMTGSLYLINQERFDQDVDKEFTNYFDSDNRILDKTEQDLTRGGTVYYYHTSVTSLKAYMLTFNQGEKIIYVHEKYWNPYSSSLRSISVWGFDGKNYYEVLIHGIEDVPTAEWYLSFGLTPYVENTEAT